MKILVGMYGKEFDRSDTQLCCKAKTNILDDKYF